MEPLASKTSILGLRASSWAPLSIGYSRTGPVAFVNFDQYVRVLKNYTSMSLQCLCVLWAADLQPVIKRT